jgi:cell wall-associated NlpC family hydrolase
VPKVKKFYLKIVTAAAALIIATDCAAAPVTPKRPAGTGPNATVTPEEIAEFSAQPQKVKEIIRSALALTQQDLTYTYASANPARGGMDCSGFIYYVLKLNGIEDVPRQSSDQYVWLRKKGTFHAVLSRDPKSFELDELKPGDLLFWTGTYDVKRDPPITHTMIFLGTEKETGDQIMVGASDGRTYRGKKRWGVSIFDFKAGNTSRASESGRSPRFVGFARIPGVRE